MQLLFQRVTALGTLRIIGICHGEFRTHNLVLYLGNTEHVSKKKIQKKYRLRPCERGVRVPRRPVVEYRRTKGPGNDHHYFMRSAGEDGLALLYCQLRSPSTPGLARSLLGPAKPLTSQPGNQDGISNDDGHIPVLGLVADTPVREEMGLLDTDETIRPSLLNLEETSYIHARFNEGERASL